MKNQYALRVFHVKGKKLIKKAKSLVFDTHFKIPIR